VQCLAYFCVIPGQYKPIFIKFDTALQRLCHILLLTYERSRSRFKSQKHCIESLQIPIALTWLKTSSPCLTVQQMLASRNNFVDTRLSIKFLDCGLLEVCSLSSVTSCCCWYRSIMCLCSSCDDHSIMCSCSSCDDRSIMCLCSSCDDRSIMCSCSLCDDRSIMCLCSSCDEAQQVTALSGKHLADIACGPMHSAALTAAGQLYVWGSCDSQSSPSASSSCKLSVPHLISASSSHFEQVACGSTDFSLLLLCSSGL